MLPTKEELAKNYSTFSDRKLLEIIRTKEGFRSEAIEAAREELKKRDVPEDTVKDFVQIKEEKRIIAAENATIPLPFHQKILFFFAWFIPFFFGTAIRLNFSEDGMLKKLKQSKWYSIAGFIALIPTTIIALAYELGNTPAIFILAGFFCTFYIIEGRINK